MTIEGKVVIITGSSSGIGKATAFRFAQEGASVVVNSRSNVVGGKQVVDEIRSKGGNATYVQANLATPGGARSLLEHAVEAFHTVDILINNAGSTNQTASFVETTFDDWLNALNDNLMTAVLCSKEVIPIMKSQGRGKIINTSSVRGLENTGREGIIAYSAAKAALINFTKTLAKELAPQITVNAVAPGFVDGPNYSKMPRELTANFINSTLIKRFIKPEEIADAFIYLANADAVTGEVLVVDGGFTLK